MRKLFAIVIIVFFINNCHAAECQQFIDPLEGEWIEYRNGDFIAQYTMKGKHALHSSNFNHASNIPDVVADAMLQLVVMRDILKYLKFQLPLESTRYLSQGASHILIRFRKLQSLNGRAFDEVRRLPSGECVLVIEIDSNYKSGNLTPAHEFFHQLQNGYTPLKRPWFYEATARWSETILGKSTITYRSIPDSDAKKYLFWDESYDALSVWYSLIDRCSHNPSRVNLPDYFFDYHYRNGAPVLQDNEIYGYKYIQSVLDKLGQLGESITNSEGLTRYRWPENKQRDLVYDKEMWKAVLDAGKCGLSSLPAK